MLYGCRNRGMATDTSFPAFLSSSGSAAGAGNACTDLQVEGCPAGMMTILQALDLAMEHHRAGSQALAEQIYRQILEVDPHNLGALHMLGVIAYQDGRNDLAIECLGKAVTVKPDFAEAHCNLGAVFLECGKSREAMASCQEALRLNPGLAEAYNNLGSALRELRRLEEAAANYQQALRLRRNYAEAHNNLGIVLRDLGKLDEAVRCHHEALRLKPDSAEAYTNLGVALKDLGRIEEAVSSYREALRLKPDYAEALSNLGLALKQQGRLNEAVRCHQDVVRLKRDSAEAHTNLGVALKDLGRLEEAIGSYQQALRLKPDYAEALSNLGVAFAEQGKLNEAVRCHHDALSLNPDFAEGHNNLGSALVQRGNLAEAVTSYERALLLQPDFAEAHKNLGIALLALGELVEAAACFRQAMRVDPRHFSGGAHLAQLLRGRLPDEERDTLEQVIAAGSLTEDERSALHFGLAHVYDARGAFAEAAEHLRRANALQLRVLQKRDARFDPVKQRVFQRAFIDLLIASFTREFFASVQGYGLEIERPVFIVGLPRSGTTLTEQVLASHSQVFGAGELRFGFQTFESLPQVQNRQVSPFLCLADLDRETVRCLAQRHLDRLAQLNAGAQRIVDKMPSNYLFLGFLVTLFPQARFIHCRRGLRDTALSCWMTNFSEINWACDPEHITGRFHEYLRLMEHWRQVSPAQILEVQYEEMVGDLEGTARRLISWIGLEWEPSCLDFHKTRRTVRTASSAQVRQALYNSSVGRWKNYETLLPELFAQL